VKQPGHERPVHPNSQICLVDGSPAVPSPYSGESDDVFIIDDDNAWNWLKRHIGPLSSIFPCTARSLATGGLAVRFAHFHRAAKHRGDT
jgi:hypothetical protein